MSNSYVRNGSSFVDGAGAIANKQANTKFLLLTFPFLPFDMDKNVNMSFYCWVIQLLR